MEILILLIPLGVVIAFAIGAAFWWSAENGQFDDLESPGQRILIDDDRPLVADVDANAKAKTKTTPEEKKAA